MSGAPREMAPRRELFAWCTFDFANSGYTTVIITAVFNAYFVAVVAEGRPEATFLWTLALAVSYTLVLVSAPVVGAIADFSATKKRFLAWTTSLCVLSTAALYLVGPGDLWLAAVLIILSNTFYAAGENLIAAFLPELAPPEALGRLSGYGWAWGYVGGLLSLGLCLLYLRWADSSGIATVDAVPVTNLIVAALFGLSALPTFLWLPERSKQATLGSASKYVAMGFARLRNTWHEAQRFADLRQLLVCLFTYQCGINVVTTLAAVFAQQTLGFSTEETIQLVLVVNVSAAAGAFVFGPIQDRIGSKKTIAITLVLWTITALGAAAVQNKWQLLVIGNLAGLAIGSSQSAGRAMVALFAPASKTAEFFGLWGLAIKSSSVVGPLTYGLLTLLTGSHRLAVVVTSVFFIVGLVLLRPIDEARGRRAALAYDEAG